MGTFVVLSVVLLALATPAGADVWDFTWRSTGSIPNRPGSAFDVSESTTATVTFLPGGTPSDPVPQLILQWASPAGLATTTIRQVGGTGLAFGGIPEFLPFPDTSGPPQWRLGTATTPGIYTWTGAFESPLSFRFTLQESHSSSAPFAQFAASGAVKLSGRSAGGLIPIATVNQPMFNTGQTLSTTVGLINPGIPATADFYLGLVRPDGTVMFFTGGGEVIGSLSDAASFHPLATNVSLAAPFSVQVPNFFVHTWTGAEQAGSYVFFLLAVKPGAVASGVVSDDEILALATTNFAAFP